MCFSKISLIFLSCLSGLAISAQQKKIIYYDQNWNITRSENASYYREMTLDKNGTPVGIVRDHYADGGLQWQGKIFFMFGDSESYDSVATWYYENGNVQQKQLYKNGLADGFDSVFYEDGKKQYAHWYENGKPSGEWLAWHENGNVAGDAHYVNGEFSGKVINYFENGKKQTEDFYVDGLQEGDQKTWYEDGSSYVQQFHRGVATGNLVRYFPDGHLLSRETFANDKPVGKHFGLTEKGDTAWVKIFNSKGKAINQRFYDDEHHLIGTFTFDSLTKKEVNLRFFPNGKLEHQEMRINNRREGRSLTYYSNGKLSEAIIFKNDRQLCDSTWYENGKVKTVQNNFPGMEMVDVVYDENGKKLREKIPDSLAVHIAKDNVGCLYGLKNNKNKWIVEPTFNSISTLLDGFFLVVKDEKCGVYGITGQEIIEPQYENISTLFYYSAYSMYNGYVECPPYYGYFIAQKNGKKGVVNSQNKTIIPFSYEYISLSPLGKNINLGSGNYGSGFPSETSYQIGYADTMGFISPMKYKHDLSFDDAGFSTVMYDAPLNKPHEIVFGVIDFKGKTIIPPVYDYIFIYHKNGNSDFFWVTKGDKTGLCDRNGKFILDTIYQMEIHPEQFYDDSMKNISLNGRSGIVGNDGHFILQPHYDSLYANRTDGFYKEGKLYGLLGKDFSVVTQPIYQSIQAIPFTVMNGNKSEQRNCFLVKRNSKYGLVNDRDSVLLPFEYDDAWIPSEHNFFAMIKGQKLELRSMGAGFGKIIFENNLHFKNGVAIFNRQGYLRSDDKGSHSLSGVVKKDGTILLQPKYNVQYAGRDGIVFTNYDTSGIMSPDGKLRIIPKEFSNLACQGNGFIYVTTSSEKVGVLDMNAKLVVDTSFFSIASYNLENHGFWVKTTSISKTDEDYYLNYYGGWEFLNENGKRLTKPIWYRPTDFFDSIAIVFSGNNYGLLQRDGKLLLDTAYETIIRDQNGYFHILKNDRWGFADPKGKIIVSPQWTKTSGFLGNVMFVYNSKNQAGLVDSTGKILVRINSLGTSSYSRNLAEEINFFDRGYSPDESVHYIPVDPRPMSEVIPTMDSLYPIKNNKAKIKASNFLIGLAALDYTSYQRLDNFNHSYWSDDFYHGYNYSGDDEDYGVYATEDSTYFVSVSNATAYSFSVLMTREDCYSPPRGMGYCSSKDTFMNFAIRGDSLCLLKMDSLFDTKKNYRIALNGMLLNALRQIDDPDFDCSNPQDYAVLVGNNFSICDTAVVFYLPRHPGSNSGDDDYLSVPILFKTLQPIMNKKSILWKLMEKK
jgi:antitoxin component YwqK of YwqJK toxin-antitoxin module